MEYLFGVKTSSGVTLVADRSVFHSIITLSGADDKSYQLGDKLVMLCVGEGGDAPQFAEFIEKNLKLYKIRNRYEQSPKAAAHYTRREIATALRSRNPYFVHTIMGGFDSKTDSSYLCYIDYLAAQFESPYVMHGHGARFCYSIMDRFYRPDMSREEVLGLINKCLAELKTRFVINFNEFMVMQVDREGVHKLGMLTAKAE